MTIKLRNYQTPQDYQRVGDFLLTHYLPGNRDGNWIEPAWEYMHGHPHLDSSSLEKIGVWEEGERIVSIAHYESQLGEAFFQLDPAYRHQRQEMLEYAERYLYGVSEKDGQPYLCAYINDYDVEFLSIARERGYEHDPERDRPMAKFDIPRPFPPITLPEGFRLTSIADERDWAKVHRVLWRGFDHDGEPPSGQEELESRRAMFETPRARLDLKVVTRAPHGEFASLCGMFYVPSHCYAYVEPVATDPSYRRMGLGKAAVLEGIRRCAALGATTAYVGSDQEFYKALGFKVIYNSECWIKYLE